MNRESITRKDVGKFKNTFYSLSYKRMRESKATENNADFGSANAILEETATQLANLAKTTQVNRNVIVILVDTIYRLVK